MFKICQNCNTEFNAQHSEIKCCSILCSNELRKRKTKLKRKKVCPICNNEFIAKRNQKSCSKKCSNELKKIRTKEKLTKKCEGCNNEFVARDKTKKYCSRECFYNHVFTKKKTKEHRLNIAKAQKNVKKEGFFKCDRCGKSFNSNTSVRAHKSHCQHEIKIKECFKCGKKCKGNAGLKAHQIWCLDDNKNKSKKEKITYAVRMGNIRRIQLGIQNQSKDTDIEILFKEFLSKEPFAFKHSYLFQTDKHNHLFDFYIKDLNLLIETDGDYWHGNKGELKDWQLNQIEIDKTYTKAAIKEGFKVIRFWGSSIKKNCYECVQEAIRYGKTGEREINGHSRDIRHWS
jgi:very-short-patch-repair endonuclease